MPPGTIISLGLLSQMLLDRAVEIIETTTTGAPESRFVSVTKPAIDCAFIAVQMSRLADDATTPTGLASKRRDIFGRLPLPTFDIYVVRCTTPLPGGGQLPTDEAKTATALTVQEDAWALWNGLRDDQDALFDGCIGIYLDYGQPVAERGGYVGWITTLRVPIEGYP